MKPTPFTLLLLFLLLLGATAHAGGGPQNVLVLINDASEDSQAVAEHYARARGIPARNLVRLTTETGLVIPYDRYVEEIRNPLLAYLRTSGLENQIDYLVATLGFPIRITLPAGGQKHVSLTAALQALGTRLESIPKIDAGRGILRNPYLGAGRGFSRRLALGEKGVRIYLATMLTGFKREDAMALVDRALEAEASKPPPGLFLFQDAAGNAKTRNGQYDRAVEEIRRKGFQARHIGPGVEGLQGSGPLIAWFSGGSYSRLNREVIGKQKYLPGAIVDMLQSFGAVPENFTDKGKKRQVPITWAIEAGATAVHGAVAEPFTVAFPSARTPLLYLEGYNVAESFFLCIPTFYWQNLLIGDPLCAPYAKPPAFEPGLDRLAGAPLAGRVTVPARGEGIARFELYVDGLLRASAEGGERLTWDTRQHADGPVRLRVVAISAGPTATQAAATRQVLITNPEFRVLRAGLPEGRTVAGAKPALEVLLSRAAGFPVARGGVLLTDPEGRLVPVTVQQTGSNRLRITPKARLAASTRYTLTVTPALRDAEGRRLERETRTEFRTTAYGLHLAGPEKATAGERVEVTVRALGAAGADAPTDTGYAGTLKVTAADPKADRPGPVALRSGQAKVGLLLRTAGTWEVTAVDSHTGLTGTTRIVVEPGPFDKLSLDLAKEWPAGHALEVTLTTRDRFGNPTPQSTPLLQVWAGADGPHLAGLGPHDRGSRTLLLPCPWQEGELEVRVMKGREKLADGKVKLTAGSLRRWLRLGAFEPPRGKVLEAPKAPREAPCRGGVTADRAWVPDRSDKNPPVLDWLKKNRSGWIATGVIALEKTKVQLILGVGGCEATLHLDGKPLKDPVASGPFRPGLIRIKRTLTPGYHWIGVALRKRRDQPPKIQLDLAGPEGGAPPPGVCFYPDNPYREADKHSVSGYVRVGWHGLAKVKVELVDAKGRRKRTRTEADGFYHFPKVAPGPYTVRPTLAKRTWEPGEIPLVVTKGNLWDRNFAVTDKEPPTVRILSPKRGTKVGRSLNVRAEVKDDLRVQVVTWEVDGKEMGKKRWGPPWTTLIQTHRLKKGVHVLAVVAKDQGGNVTRKEIKFVVK